MAKLTIPAGNWTTALADTLDQAEDGDTIVVQSERMKELGERALSRRKDGKKVSFVVEAPSEEQNDA